MFDVEDGTTLVGAVGTPVEALAAQSLRSGTGEVSTDSAHLISEAAAALSIPVYRNGQIVSVAVLSAKRGSQERDDVVGVFEIWEPVGVYREVGLKAGYYGRMERFRNVSTFVRFERGNGLPGQVWQGSQSVIHDDLSNHPGFLRAAGASAELLRTAVGLPIGSDDFRAAALMISSTISPLARGFEVWSRDGDGFVLAGSAWNGLRFDDESIDGAAVARLSATRGLPGLATSAGGAVLCDDADRIVDGRTLHPDSEPVGHALAIPFYQGEALTSVTTLLF